MDADEKLPEISVVMYCDRCPVSVWLYPPAEHLIVGTTIRCPTIRCPNYGER